MSRRHRDALVAEALPDSIELVIVGVRAGLSPTRAVELAARRAAPVLADAFGEVVHRLHRGHRLADALSALPAMLGPCAAGFADTLASADRCGLPIGPVLDRLADEVRTERRRHSERFARTLPIRLSFPLVVCTLPAFVLLAIVPAVLGAVSTLQDSVP
jgi:tight adherence protein C